jgi:hypothetical protein
MTSSSTTAGYARSTRASVARSTPQSPVSKHRAPKKPNRPSTLPAGIRHRHTSLEPLTIKTTDSRKSCPLVNLPPEVRLRIYSYLLPKECNYSFTAVCWRSKWSKDQTPISSWVSLFRVCRLIHAEVVYEFYTKATIAFTGVCIDDHEGLTKWLLSIGSAQRSLLAKNPNLTLVLLINPYRPVPSVEKLWSRCKRFGNVYDTPTHQHELHFDGFCKMASWWLWCAGPIGKDITWSYEFAIRRYRNEIDRYGDLKEMEKWFHHVLLTVALPCVQTAWVRERREKEMKKQALNMLEDADFGMLLRRRILSLPPLGDTDGLGRKIRSVRKFLNEW